MLEIPLRGGQGHARDLSEAKSSPKWNSFSDPGPGDQRPPKSRSPTGPRVNNDAVGTASGLDSGGQDFKSLSSIIYELCDSRQVTRPLWASISSSINVENTLCLTELGIEAKYGRAPRTY